MMQKISWVQGDDFLEAFLKHLPPPVIQLPKLPKNILEFVSDADDLQLKPKHANKYASNPYFRLKSQQIKWASECRTHGVAFAPVHQYCVERPNPQWERTGFSKYQQGEKYDLFHMDRNQWFYTGTYEVVGLQIFPLTRVRAQNPDIADAIIWNTAPLKNGLLDMIKGMYEAGLLKVECIALRRAGFNMSLYHSMVACRKLLEEKAKANALEAQRTVEQGSKRKLSDAGGSLISENGEVAKKARTDVLRALVPYGSPSPKVNKVAQKARPHELPAHPTISYQGPEINKAAKYAITHEIQPRTLSDGGNPLQCSKTVNSMRSSWAAFDNYRSQQ
ncbi:hypothetical protein NEOLEDRAFT_2792 [Neolentinus lepideus HHB14362 ss-1]|uniref:Uncharacterized protein n=1 Tax=Neolentinus lepideus HHB14362 ss-1 TaxID=1314782 RepID=A0A165VXX8_9AGAM|nr:hypothetical protein NEOLEDRAFT_2792 [Neolentinus lepideus HHB14362 ss-1]